MIPLIEPLPIVESYCKYFESHFSERTYSSFKRYLSGLLINENKTVEGINRLFVLDIHPQIRMNRFLTTSCFDEKALNTSRLEWLQGVVKWHSKKAKAQKVC